ncbi:hypothetical protein [Cellulomonas marina]|uniref:Uncharacterized protein n=1 Tax=Cellulomonas marina TaxID=988821 RepID=A0A1I0XWN0_9CELL|nr:hypothetical protein [Cellulomonas marina]GIG28490.1 hypothetical protein Cma02nite_10900 [Cellulomonas marina]SFB05422.1 hypothetical protein SAMN05421867_10630 [Cellulomonas marina]
MTWVLLLVVTMVTSSVLWLVWMLVPTGHDADRRSSAPARTPAVLPQQGSGTNRVALLDGPMNGRAKGEEGGALDPFDALLLQTRLSAVVSNVRELEDDPTAYARTTRLLACQLAYDALLAEACGLAGIEVDRRRPMDESERFREESELVSRGWTW